MSVTSNTDYMTPITCQCPACVTPRGTAAHEGTPESVHSQREPENTMQQLLFHAILAYVTCIISTCRRALRKT